MGTVLLMLSGVLLVNVGESPQLFTATAVAIGSGGLYLLLAGAVARGIEVSRR